ncbi:hypothetical protein HZS_6315 [Henneguya salminicola]|nr:hypothetical protein HZS_6315 [Henneguya salminicola]
MEKINFNHIKTKLMPHQIDAINWMRMRESCTPFGGILVYKTADDMGLGKTLTILSLLCQNIEESSLVIVPTSVLHQWKYEINKHLTKFSYIIYHGKDRSKYESRLKGVNLVITTYGTFSSKVHDSKTIQSIPWSRIILDEAHYIKNFKCISFKPIFEAQSSILSDILSIEYRWALSGTPIHNSLTDFYSLIKFIRFEPFNDHKFWIKYVEKHKNKIIILDQVVKLVVLRRTKSQRGADGNHLIKLPKKQDILHNLYLSSEERSHYDSINEKLTKAVRDFFGVGSEQGARKYLKTYGQVLVSLLRLQQACCHLCLLNYDIVILVTISQKPDEGDVSISDINELTCMLDGLSIEPSEKSVPIEFNKKFKSVKIGKMLEILSNEKINSTIKWYVTFLMIKCNRFSVDQFLGCD